MAYHASHAIFVREGAEQPHDSVDTIPEPLEVSTVSLRAFNDAGEMVDADLADGRALQPLIERFLANPTSLISTRTMRSAVATPPASTECDA